MTEKELRRLRRSELLELLLDQAQELEKTQAELAEAQEQLKQREILLSNAGSIAEAALQLNHVFEAAQSAGEQYIDSLRALYERTAAGQEPPGETAKGGSA
jgi:glutathione S-transferase